MPPSNAIVFSMTDMPQCPSPASPAHRLLSGRIVGRTTINRLWKIRFSAARADLQRRWGSLDAGLPRARSGQSPRRRAGRIDLRRQDQVVPAEGIEPPTFGLQNRCSTAELSRRSSEIGCLMLRGASDAKTRKVATGLPPRPPYHRSFLVRNAASMPPDAAQMPPRATARICSAASLIAPPPFIPTLSAGAFRAPPTTICR